MKRREMLKVTGAALLGSYAFPLGWAGAAEEKKPRILYFTRSAGFEHSVVRRQGDQLSHSEKIMVEVGKREGVEVICSKDGRLFDKDLDQFDCIAFYTSGDLTKPNQRQTPPMSETEDETSKSCPAVSAVRVILVAPSATVMIPVSPDSCNASTMASSVVARSVAMVTIPT